MAGKTIGIEIGNDTVKLVVASGGKVTDMAVKRLPDNMVMEGRVSTPDAMIAFLKDMRKEFRIPSGSCALTLPYHSVISNVLTVPPMSDAELALNLPFEFRDYVGQDGGKYRYDYAVMSTEKKESGEAEKLEVFAAAVRKDLVQNYYDMLKKAGLTAKVIVPHEMAMLNLVREGINEPEELCIVDVGHTATHVYLFANKRFVMGREIEIGGQMLDAAIARSLKMDTHMARSLKESDMDNILKSEECNEVFNALAVEIMKVVNFYNNYGSRSANLRDVYLCGGMSDVEGISTAIKKATDLVIHHIARLVPGGVENHDTLCCAIAAGAAIQ